MTRLLLLPYALIASAFLSAMDHLGRDVPVAIARFEAATA